MIKAGKGYREDGHPIGPISGICNECGGIIIALKMNTSARGFETTAEKVCKECGLTVPGAFQVLEPQPLYGTIYEDSYEQWLEKMKPITDMDDVDAHLENMVHLYGKRMNTDDDVGYGGYGYKDFHSEENRIGTEASKRLRKAIARLAKTNASKKMPMQDWREKQYHDIVDDYIHELELSKYQALDVHYIITHRGNMFNTRYSMDIIIYHVCLIVGEKDLRKYREHNRGLYDLLTDRLGL